MKLLSQSPEAVAAILGVTEAEASALLNERRLAELQEREARQRNLAEACSGVRNRNAAMKQAV